MTKFYATTDNDGEHINEGATIKTFDSLAAAQAKQSAQRNLDTLAPKMRARDIAKAERLTENWRATTAQ